MIKITDNILPGGCTELPKIDGVNQPTLGGCIELPKIDGVEQPTLTTISMTSIFEKIGKMVGYQGRSETTTQPSWDGNGDDEKIEFPKSEQLSSQTATPSTEKANNFTLFNIFGYQGRSETTTQPSWDGNGDDDSYSVSSDSSTHSVKEEPVKEETKLEVYDSIDAILGQMG